MFSDLLVCKLFISGLDAEKADALMNRILDMEDSFILRAGHPDGKDDKKRTKAYYRSLRADLRTEVNAITVEMGRLNNEREA